MVEDHLKWIMSIKAEAKTKVGVGGVGEGRKNNRNAK